MRARDTVARAAVAPLDDITLASQGGDLEAGVRSVVEMCTSRRETFLGVTLPTAPAPPSASLSVGQASASSVARRPTGALRCAPPVRG